MFEEYPDILTAREVMEILGISKNAFYKMINNGTIPAFRLGEKMWRVRKDELVGSLNRK